MTLKAKCQNNIEISISCSHTYVFFMANLFATVMSVLYYGLQTYTKDMNTYQHLGVAFMTYFILDYR